MATRDDKGRFVPGESGNPGGRPKRVARSELLAILEEIEQDGASMGQTVLRAALRRVTRIAVDGRDQDALAATKWIVEQVDGKVPVAIADVDTGGLTIVFQQDPPAEEIGSSDQE